MRFAAFILALGLAFTGADASAAQPLGYEALRHIANRNCECIVTQGADEVQGNVLRSLIVIRPRMENASHFNGTGTTLVYIDGQKYTAEFTLRGFGFDDTYDGTGLLIQRMDITRSDQLPGSMFFQSDTNIELTAVPNGGRMPVRLTGTHNGSEYDCE